MADFGFCKLLNSQTAMTKTIVGSPIYMAPEILRGKPYTSKADIWSLGILLYELLYGCCPFEAKSIPKLLKMVLT